MPDYADDPTSIQYNDGTGFTTLTLADDSDTAFYDSDSRIVTFYVGTGATSSVGV